MSLPVNVTDNVTYFWLTAKPSPAPNEQAVLTGVSQVKNSEQSKRTSEPVNSVSSGVRR